MCEYTPIQLQCDVFFSVIGLTGEGPRCSDPGHGWKIYGLICGVGGFDRSSIQYNVIRVRVI